MTLRLTTQALHRDRGRLARNERGARVERPKLTPVRDQRAWRRLGGRDARGPSEELEWSSAKDY